MVQLKYLLLELSSPAIFMGYNQLEDSDHTTVVKLAVCE